MKTATNTQTGTQAQHTPGPWHVSDVAQLKGEFVFAADGYAIADCRMFHGRGDMQANARLIAAAPELLALAQKVAKGAKSPTVEGAIEWLAEIRSEAATLITKAGA